MATSPSSVSTLASNHEPLTKDSCFRENIFREYDVRGIFDRDFNRDFAGLLGPAISTLAARLLKKAQPLTIGVGRDVRLSGEGLFHTLVESLLNLGHKVVDLGVVPTPLVYFASHHYGLDAAIAITGSHNPAEYNGFKICVGKETLHGHSIQELKELVISKAFHRASSSSGSKSHKPLIEDYMRTIAPQFKFKRKLKVVVDAGNATGGLVAPQLLRQLGCEVVELFCEVDGRFPNHHPDPTVQENLKDIKAAVQTHRADLGLAFDGDSDRIGVVDEKSQTIFGDELMVLYSREILKRKPGSKIIGEVKCSSRLYDDIAKHGGRPLMWKTGHSLIKSKMKEEKAELAGEMSGHIFFQDRYYGFDDAIYASLRLLEILDQSNAPLSSLLQDLPPAVNTPELRLDCPDELKFQVVDMVKTELAKRFETIGIDGVRIQTGAGWGLLRASNTQPVVVMRFEAQNKDDLLSLQSTVEQEFKKALAQLTS